MKLRAMLPVIVVVNFLVAGGLYVASDNYRTRVDWVPPPDPYRLELIAIAEASANAEPPAHTTLDNIDASKLMAGCPPLAHEPWRGRIQSLKQDQLSLSTFALMADEPLAITGETFSRRASAHHPQTRFSLSALPLDPDDPVETRTILSREFRWFAHQDERAVYYYEQPSADGQDAIVSVDRNTFAEKRWSLPLIPTLPDAPIYGISVPGNTLDGKLIVQIFTGTPGSDEAGGAPQLRSGLCLLDPRSPASTTPPRYVIVPDLQPIAMSWPTGPNEILALAAYPLTQKRLLINVATGTVREVAPTERRFHGYCETPPRIARDQALNSFLLARNKGDGSQQLWSDGPLVYGTAAIRLSMPSAALVPTGAPTIREAGSEAFQGWEFLAGAPRYTTPAANSIGRFSLGAQTRDLALVASRELEMNPFTIEALDASRVLLLQVVPPQPTAKDAALRGGCLRLGILTPATGAESWVGTVAFPEAAARIPHRLQIRTARQGDSFVITMSGSSTKPRESHEMDTEEGEFWTRLPWPEAFPDDVPDGWLGNITPRPGTPIP